MLCVTNSEQSIVATDYTYSCTNLLIYFDYFAFLVHMLPSEAIGKNCKLLERINLVERIIKVFGKLISEINVLVCQGISTDENQNLKFHDLSFVNNQLKDLQIFCQDNNINYNRYSDEVSKYLIFDCVQKKLFIDNDKKINHF